MRHSTSLRLVNFLLVEMEMRLGSTKLLGHPYVTFIDPINMCNLRWPLCPTGTNDLVRTRGAMELHLFKHDIDEVAPCSFEVTLDNWGEPLLHKHIFEMIRYAAEKNLATSISANFNLVHGEQFEELIE